MAEITQGELVTGLLKLEYQRNKASEELEVAQSRITDLTAEVERLRGLLADIYQNSHLGLPMILQQIERELATPTEGGK